MMLSIYTETDLLFQRSSCPCIDAHVPCLCVFRGGVGIAGDRTNLLLLGKKQVVRLEMVSATTRFSQQVLEFKLATVRFCV